MGQPMMMMNDDPRKLTKEELSICKSSPSREVQALLKHIEYLQESKKSIEAELRRLRNREVDR